MTEVVHHQGERVTPLIAAIRRGDCEIVKALLETYGVDVNQCGAVCIDKMLFKDASPLWVATVAGFINIVRYLIEAGALINHRTETGSTPVQAACIDGKLDIVRYLTECGADIEIPNSYDSTCLMIASFGGYLDTVSFLLEAGADPNKHTLSGATALHFAVEFGHMQVIERLLEAGATITKMKTGFTPIMLAAEQTKENVVRLFLGHKNVHLPKQEVIDVFELLGASFANDQKSYDLAFCLRYLRLGMELRFDDPENPIPKPSYALVPAYENRVESQTMAELDAIADDENALHMESLIIRERLLHPNFSYETTTAIVYRGKMLSVEGRYERCIALWLHRLSLLLKVGSCLNRDVHRFIQMFSWIFSHQHCLNIEDLIAVLNAARADFVRQRELVLWVNSTYDEEDIDCLISSIMNLLVIGTMLSESVSQSDRMKFNQAVYQLVKVDVRTTAGKTLLHLSADPSTKINDALRSFGIKFPFEPVASLLMEVGANVNDVDFGKNTPLHLVVGPRRGRRDFRGVQKIINKLLENGAHIDAVNCKGLDPHQSTTSTHVQMILRSHCKVNTLKCLAARAMCKYGQASLCPYPPDLSEFVKVHGPDL